MSTRDIASLGMAFRRWSFSGNDDGNSSDVVTTDSTQTVVMVLQA